MIFELLLTFFKVAFGYLFGDFIMGIYHWVKDTYFSPFTPIIGSTFIWGSRLHHVRPRHVLESNDLDLFWDSGKWTLIWMLPVFYIIGINPFTLSLFLTISINDIVHKYAHAYDNERPQWATFLQNINIFQSHDEHHLHHIAPHEINYCPITPFVNPILEKINFWRKLEQYIENHLGVKPRAKEYDFIEDSNYPAGIKFLE
ncbi:putative ubiquitin-conjugating enzyme E2 [Saudi moumouvirus]|nr:putative ubiquitin-conjugating enzyme E2 [Saudi moumouvirus]